MTRLALFAMLLAAALPALALSGTVTRVSDGDTLWIRPDVAVPGADARRGLKVRLQGIDAPELCQAWGPQAKAALESRILHRRVELRSRATDDYRRSVGILQVDGEDVGGWMVRQGHAWSARFRHSPGPYAAQEQAARDARRGLFASRDPIEPRAFRKTHGSCR